MRERCDNRECADSNNSKSGCNRFTVGARKAVICTKFFPVPETECDELKQELQEIDFLLCDDALKITEEGTVNKLRVLIGAYKQMKLNAEFAAHHEINRW